jgi:uncharacterized protein (TIGR04222 family)
VRRILIVGGLLVTVVLTTAGPASATERIDTYDVAIVIEQSGDLVITETIVYDFGDVDRRGIFRDVPTRLRWEPDEAYERVYPMDVVSVASPTAPDRYVTEDAGGGRTRIRIGDPDITITGRHSYEIVYRIRGGLNGFDDHDELYWNAIGADWGVVIGSSRVTVEAPAPVMQVACFAGPDGSNLPCDRAASRGSTSRFVQGRLWPYSAFTVVVAIPPGSVDAVGPILEERLTPITAIGASPTTVGGAIGLGVLLIGGVGALLWTRGRDVAFLGSQVDQVMGGTPGHEARVGLGDADAEAPVEFAPPEELRPGQIGTLVDEHANTLDVTATIVDLAVRGYLRIEEIPKTWFLGKPDWQLVRLPPPEDPEATLLQYERTLLSKLFSTGDEVLLSDLKNTFAASLRAVQEAMYRDAVQRGWFRERPDKVRARWTGIGVFALVLSGAATFVLATQLRLGLLGIPLVLASLLLLVGARRMPARTAKGTALVRRVRGFQVVIEKAETHMSRWAEEAGVFTRYLPFAIVFGCTERWAKAFESIGAGQPDTSWYVSSRPFVYHEFASSLDGFTVSTSGTIASTPSGSGGSGFSGGSSGGGGGGGGGGSW